MNDIQSDNWTPGKGDEDALISVSFHALFLFEEDHMPEAYTVYGNKRFRYSGSLETGLVVHKGVDIAISVDTIRLIKTEIARRNPVLMGACRDNPSRNSLGETLRGRGITPQVLSYVVPLLVDSGYCTTNNSKPLVISRRTPIT